MPSACHTCRRRRVKCDFRTPKCGRCEKSGVECLGYGKLITWVQGVASRGKMMGKSYKPSSTPPVSQSTEMRIHVQRALMDPFLQDLSSEARHHLNHFYSRVWEDLVIYHLPMQTWNPCSELYWRSQTCPAMFHVIMAMAAYHRYNLITSKERAQSILVDALQWKQGALVRFQTMLSRVQSTACVQVLVCSMLLANFDLLESGRDTWQLHLDSAWVISSILIQSIFGSTFSPSVGHHHLSTLNDPTVRVLDSLVFAEGNHFLSCPAELASCIVLAFQTQEDSQTPSRDACQELYESVQQFDPAAWATAMQCWTPVNDYPERLHIGSAYKTAVVLYLSRMLPNFSPGGCTPERQTGLVQGVIGHISQVPASSALFKSTIWSSFVAGAEATDPHHREWVAAHLDAISAQIPWNTTVTATEALREVWRRVDLPLAEPRSAPRNWIQEFRRLKVAVFPA
ncbi:Zn(II)2Cys6 transcription factor [Aspergillus aculeatinus CBS 121060]|uniref:Uncharacterized protein n=1 Tax=Aspergillus aculeatinus CBS 121060 TaxID=1448322 RepID=A0ACD1H951_9EURO|nr:hypothetical protein BO66DRAFT_438741 [Aspergillus aculeatinus CBS 121060]RAH70036.1 hypothetical protein BO66DRAFT_438741 [Aspergillus aculeatinus CBS 121060]